MTASSDASAKKRVLARGKQQAREFAYAFEEESGKLIGEARGGRYEVELTLAIKRAIADPAQKVVLHHNHPRSTSFSRADIEVLASNAGLSKLWAHAHNGSTFSAARVGLPIDLAAYESAAGTVKSELERMIAEARLTRDQAALLEAHLICLIMDRKGLLRYTAKLKGPSGTAFAGNEDELTEFVNRHGTAD